VLEWEQAALVVYGRGLQPHSPLAPLWTALARVVEWALPETSHACSWHSALGAHQYQRHCQGQHSVCGRMGKRDAWALINISSRRLATLLIKIAVDEGCRRPSAATNSLCPIIRFVPFVAVMRSVVEFYNMGLRYGVGVEALTDLSSLAGLAFLVYGWIIVALIPLAVAALAMLMARFTVISALKKML